MACGTLNKKVTWLILPVVICLSQRLSHACVRINKFYSVNLRTAHYISNYLFDGNSIWIPVVILELIHA